jgi:hypothetical protein
MANVGPSVTASPSPQGLLLSVPLMLEYEEVLKGDDMRAKSHLTLEEIDVLLDMLAAVGTPQTPFSSGAPSCPISMMKWC